MRAVAELLGHERGVRLEVDAVDRLERPEARPRDELERPALRERTLPRPRLRARRRPVHEHHARPRSDALHLHERNDTKWALDPQIQGI